MRALRCLILVAVISLLQLRAVHAQLLRPMAGADQVHTVQDGETLYSLAHDNHLSLEHVSISNRLPMQLEIPVGTIVTLPTRHVLPANPPRDGLVLNVPERAIFFFRHGHFVNYYPVAVGRIGFLTPRGNFRIIEKTKDPTWVPPAWAEVHEPIGPGSKNPLGDRWIGTSATRVGIHGTQSPYSIGMVISHGCIRMYPDQVRELYDQVYVGMPVRIEYETAKLGVDRETGNVYLATFPDIYHLQDPVAEATREIRAAGLSDKISPQRIRELAIGNFRATPIVGSDFVATVGDERVHLTVEPIVRGQTLWLPAEFLRQIGLQVRPSDAGLLTVSNGNDQMLMSVKTALPPPVEPPDTRGTLVTDASGKTVRQIQVEDGKPVSTAYRYNGHTYVCADDVFDYFNLKYDWQVARQSLTLSRPIEAARAAAP